MRDFKFRSDEDEESFIDIVDGILKSVGFKIRHMQDERTGKDVYCLVNIDKSFLAQNSGFNSKETEQIKKMLKYLVKKDMATCVPEGFLITKHFKHGIRLRKRLLASGYFVAVPKESGSDEMRWYVGPRLIAEMPDYLEELKCETCPVCKQFVVLGERAFEYEGTKRKAHFHCLRVENAPTSPAKRLA